MIEQTIDIKWLLYRYHSIKLAKETAERMLSKMTIVHESFDPNWWIRGRGGFPSNPTSASYFKNESNADKIEQLDEYIRKLGVVIEAIDSSVKGLKKELHDLIVFRYIEDLDVNTVAEKLGLVTENDELNLRKYYRLHNIALEGMNIGCMPLNFLFKKGEIEVIIGKLCMRKSVSSVSQKRVEIDGELDTIVS